VIFCVEPTCQVVSAVGEVILGLKTSRLSGALTIIAVVCKAEELISKSAESKTLRIAITINRGCRVQHE
jgi:hypothetical protein